MEREQNTSSLPPEDITQPETKGRDASLLTQHGIFPASGEHGAECTETLVRIGGSQVVNPPVVRVWHEKKRKKKEWKCTFVAPPDLWSQERAEWIQARAVCEGRATCERGNRSSLISTSFLKSPERIQRSF